MAAELTADKRAGDILVVDDNPENLRLLTSVLAQAGYHARPASSGAIALQSIQHRLPDLILLDIRMPDMDGYEVCRQLKSNARSAEIPVIFISALEEEADKLKAFGVGAVDYLTKPFHETEVLARIATHLKLFRMQRNLEEMVAERTSELQKSHALYKNAQEIARLGHWEYDLVANRLTWSDEIYRIFEVDSASFSPSYDGFLDLIHPEDRSRVDEAYQSSLESKARYDITHRILLANGQVKYVHEQGRSTYDQAGRPLRSLGTVQDVTSQMRMMAALRQTQEEWERTFQAIGDVAMVLDPQHQVVRANRAACEMLSATPEDELVGRFCHELFSCSPEQCNNCPVTRSISDGKSHSGEIFHPHLEKTFVSTASPVLDKDGKVKSVVNFAKDVSEQRALEGQLRQAQKMEAIGTLAGGIAHDFNNILTPILGYAELAKDAVQGDSTALEELDEVMKAAMRAKELVGQILTFSRQSEQELRPLEVRLVVKEALKLLRASIPTTIAIKEDISTENLLVLADPTQIHQVMMNLCTNAYHAMREAGGELTVRLDQTMLEESLTSGAVTLVPGNYIHLQVADTGLGMAPHIREKIFEPYYTTKAQGEGTGLGLSVVHGIVTGLGGGIRVKSAPGKGSTFDVFLPVLPEEDGNGGFADQQGSLPAGHEHVLVVDDEAMVVDVQRRLLAKLGYQVSAFTSCDEALAALHADPFSFDLVITDMTMPRLTGVQLAEEVFQLRGDLPVVLCTGYSEIISEEQAKALGISEFILKPIVKASYARLVRKALDKVKG